MFFLNVDEVIGVNKSLIKKYGGSLGLRDKSLLESSVFSIQHHYNYKEKTSLFELATVFVFSLTKNHPFIDGNKRTAFICMIMFLKLNGADLHLTLNEAEDNMVKIANNEMSQYEFLIWLES